MADIFEVIMMVCFGVSWPANIARSIRAKTAKGRSILNLCLIEAGYIAGVVAKVVSGNVNYVLVFYCINIVLVAIDFCLVMVNLRRDKQAQSLGN